MKLFVKRHKSDVVDAKVITEAAMRPSMGFVPVKTPEQQAQAMLFREIKRNKFVDDELPNLNGYYGMTAQRSAVNRRARRRKLVQFMDLRKHVIAQLEAGWSPEQIAGRLQYDGQSLRVSHETIYAYVYGPDGQSEELARHLRHRRKRRQPRRRRTPRGLVLPPDRSIHERPDYVNNA